jgi:methylmalonyl-CoA mutase C-terminal domain/subunit
LAATGVDAPLRIVIAKPGLDGHDRGAKVVARILRDSGHEVIYTGLRRTPEQIVRICTDEDAQVLGLSSLSGAHGYLFPRVCELLRESGLEDIIVFGGGIIPEDDRDEMYGSGMRAIFGPGTTSGEMQGFLDEIIRRNSDGESDGVGSDSDWRWGSE